MYTVHFVTISCLLFGSGYSASLFGVDFTAPARVGNTGVREISQVIKPQHPQYSNFPFGGHSQFSHDHDNTNSNENEGRFKPAPVPIFDRIKPHQPSKINKSTQENNQFSDTHIPIKDDHVPDNEKASESIPQETNQNTDVVSKQSDDYTLDLSETSITDYTTDTSDSETTTFEPLNRIGGAPPAVVASLLG